MLTDGTGRYIITLIQHNSSDSLPAPAPFLSIVVPAYNEEARLGASLTRMIAYFDDQAYSFEIAVVDDGSTDRTAAIATECSARCPKVRLLQYAPNRGKGYATRYGMLRARGARVLFSDADLATPIEEVEKLGSALDAGFDIAIGSRDVAGSELIKRQSILREMGGRAFNKFVRLLAVPNIHDTQCGFKLFTRASSDAVFAQCHVDHFAFDVEALYVAVRICGFRVAEVPVRWAHQEGSKVRVLRDAYRMLVTLVRIRRTRYVRADAPVDLRAP